MPLRQPLDGGDVPSRGGIEDLVEPSPGHADCLPQFARRCSVLKEFRKLTQEAIDRKKARIRLGFHEVELKSQLGECPGDGFLNVT